MDNGCSQVGMDSMGELLDLFGQAQNISAAEMASDHPNPVMFALGLLAQVEIALGDLSGTAEPGCRLKSAAISWLSSLSNAELNGSGSSVNAFWR